MTESARFTRHAIDENALADIARALAGAVGEGGVIHLEGPLGAGKTTFARALLRQIGVGERIKSPTYTLIESYTLPSLVAHHLDLYRIAAADELEWLGLRDLAAGPQLWLIEWPEHGAGATPTPDLHVELAHAGVARDLRLRAESERGRGWIDQLSQQVTAHS